MSAAPPDYRTHIETQRTRLRAAIETATRELDRIETALAVLDQVDASLGSREPSTPPAGETNPEDGETADPPAETKPPAGETKPAESDTPRKRRRRNKPPKRRAPDPEKPKCDWAGCTDPASEPSRYCDRHIAEIANNKRARKEAERIVALRRPETRASGWKPRPNDDANLETVWHGGEGLSSVGGFAKERGLE